MKLCSLGRMAVVGVICLVGSVARGETVTYTANLNTSKGNPVYDILILESDASQQVHATIYGSQLPGAGISVISHEVPFTPVKTLIIGLTEGMADGVDKTQIIMLLDSDFAAAHEGIKFSQVFDPVRHSATITSLQAAVAGDATELAWFTDTFFPGPAAGAAFDSFGPFTVAAFTSLTITGHNAAFGSWMITDSMTIPFDSPKAIDGRATLVLEETAKGDKGPFDISITTADSGEMVVDKTVLNNTGAAWTGFVMELGTGSGVGFVPSASFDGKNFLSGLNNREVTGAFPNLTVEQDRIVFSGFLAPGGTAHFIVYIGVNAGGTFTLRQRAVCPGGAVPVLSLSALAVLILLLGSFAALTLRRPKPAAARKHT